jgi:hypothetical protein
MGRSWERRGMHTVFGEKTKGKRKLRGPRRRRENIIKIELRKIGWCALNLTHMSQDVDQWRSVVNTAMNVGFEVLATVVTKINIFWDIMPCSLFKIHRRFGGTYRLHLQGGISRAKYERESRWEAASFALVSYSAYLTLKMEAICSSEMSADFQLTTWRYVQEDSNLR